MREASERTREIMRDELDAQQLAALGSRPLRAHVELDGVRFELVHATPSDPLYRYLRPSEPGRWAEEVERIEADVILVGHTHLPMILHFGNKVVVNPGSVGPPRDGDPRAAYAIVEDGEPRLERCEYDVEGSVAALARRRLREPVFSQLAGLLRTGRA
jgi:protein phosphatase